MSETGDRQKQIERLFQQALALPASQRERFVRERTRDHPDVCDEVAKLLESYGSARDSFLDSPVDLGLAPVLGPPREAASRPAPPPDAPPERIGQYPVVGELGRGGMGVVYRAIDPQLLREVAIKMLPPAVSDDPTWLEQFRHEARTLASINHPNIATVFSLEEDHEVSFLTMELVEGELLAERTRRGALPLDHALSIAQQMAAALEAAHQRDVVHRDLKPLNIMVTVDGRVKVLDFGLARSPSSEETDAGDRVVGTPGYMSPEQLRGAPVDVRADIWAFGCVLYECLTGVPAIRGATVDEQIAATLEGTPDWSLVPPAVPERVIEVLKRCLATAESDRPDHISSARREIEESMAARARPASPDTGGVRSAGIPNNLPVPLTSFVGRTEDTQRLSRLLGAARLVTIVGAGGSGKSRLAIEMGRQQLRGFTDGVWLVQLASVTDPADVPDAVAAALDVPDAPGRSRDQAIVEHVGERRALLILDNCEHVLSTVAPLVEHLGRSCPNLVQLATSRESLGVSGEATHAVPSLGDDAIQLFVDRAAAVLPGFARTDANAAVIATICERLDGIPLAIELAAARARVLPIEEIATRLDDRFRFLSGGSRTALPRHKTLRALIDWSYEQLDENEQRFLTRLSVFVGGWTLEAAEAVCTGDDIEAWEALDILTRLLDKSLAEAMPTEESTSRVRFRMLETIRAYAAEELTDREATETRYLAYFADLAVTAEGELMSPKEAQAIERLAADYENLRHAIEIGLSGADIAPGTLEITRAVLQLLSIRSRWREGMQVGLAALRHPAIGDADRTAVGHVHHRLGNMARPLLEQDTARHHYDEAMAIWKETGNTRNQAAVLNNRGLVAHHTGDIEQAKALFTEALALNRTHGNLDFASSNLNNLGLIATENDRVEEAVEYFSQALEMSREMGLTVYMALFADNLATAYSKLNQNDRARALHEESIALNRQVGNQRGVATTLHNLASILLDEGAHEEARALLLESLDIKSENDDTRGLLFGLESMADLAWRLGEWDHAVRLLAVADRDRERFNVPLALAQGRQVGIILASCREQLGEARFDDAWNDGLTLTLAEAVALARE